jgi:hypothetical protein
LGQGQVGDFERKNWLKKFSFFEKVLQNEPAKPNKINLVHDLAQFIMKSDFAPEYCERFVLSARFASPFLSS